MTGPDPAVAAVRVAVRRTLPPAGTVLVACSGGADSLALLAATVFEARQGPRVVGTVVDHGLQDGSAEHTARVVQQMADLGVDETASIRVTVDPGPGGIEAGAREARYAALDQLARHFRADVVLLGHTVDDQAESVLLGLTQGSGPRSLAGMRDAFRDGDGPLFVRPLLRDVGRGQTEAACRAEGIEFWEDPHNLDQRFLRARVRHVVMPLLEAELGPGVAGALARTGHLLREDLDALDGQAASLVEEHDLVAGVDVRTLAELDPALLTRLLRLAALRAGAPARDLTYGHVRALEEMVRVRVGEPRDLDLPGLVRAVRRDGVLRLTSTRPEPPGPVAG